MERRQWFPPSKRPGEIHVVFSRAHLFYAVQQVGPVGMGIVHRCSGRCRLEEDPVPRVEWGT